MAKQNCWEFKQCGKDLYGDRKEATGACPASMEKRLNGEHGGKNAGRACWVVNGTLCDDGKKADRFSKKFEDCCKCDFYKKVKSEEAADFHLSSTLLSKLKTH